MAASRSPVHFVLLLCMSLAACQPQAAPITPAPPLPTLAASATPALSLLPATSALTAAPPPTTAPLPAPPTTTSAPPETPLPTPTTAPSPVPPTVTPVPTSQPTSMPAPSPRAASGGNLRQGPGTNYAVVGGVKAGESLELLGRNEAGDWLLIKSGSAEAWIASFLVEGATLAGLPVRQSTAPTVTPPAAPAPTSQPAPTGQAPVQGNLHVSAPYNVRLEGGGLQWSWDGLSQVKGLDWYFDVRSYRDQPSKQPPELVVATAVNPAEVTFADGRWTWRAPLKRYAPNCYPSSGPECRYLTFARYVVIQIAIRDSSGRFAGWISDTSAPLEIPMDVH